MTSEKKDHGSFNFFQNKNIDFESEYREYKLFDDKFFKFESLNYKFKIVLYTSIFISSILFIMLGLFLWIISIIRDYSIIFLILLFFGYISVICLLLVRREERRFKRILLKFYEEKFI